MIRERLQLHRRYRWLVLLTVGSGMILAILSSSIVNIALPSITADFSSDLGTMTWVVTIYMIVQATLMPVLGRSGDLYGHKKIFIAGLLWFTLMSIFCALAWGPYSLIASRGLQAAAAAALSPMALSFVFSVFSAHDRAQALGIMGGLIGAAPVLGLTAGGLLVEGLGWRWVFLINLPLGLLLVPLALVVLKESEPSQRRRFDLLGGALLSGGLFTGLLGLNKGREWGWGDTRVLAAFAAMALLLAAFVAWERRCHEPLLDLDLLKLRSLVAANIAGFFSSGAMFGTLVLLPFYFQTVLGEEPAATGFKLAPLALMFVLLSPLGGRLTARLGHKLTPLTGLAIAALGNFFLARVAATATSPGAIALSLAVVGIGLGLTMAPLTAAAIHEAPLDKRGIASSLPNMFRFIGGSFTIAVFSALLGWRLSSRLLAAGVNPSQMAGIADDKAGVASGGLMPAAQQAYAAAFSDVFALALLFVAAAMTAVCFIPNQPRESRAGAGAVTPGRGGS